MEIAIVHRHDTFGSGNSCQFLNSSNHSKDKRRLSNSLRDKFAKFKEASFQVNRQLSGLQLVENISESERRPLETKGSARKRKVRFNTDRNEIRLFNLPDVPQLELWWNSEELNTSRCDGKLSAAVDPFAQEYCRAYDRAYRQVHADRKLTAAYLTELVKGLDIGCRGLEQYCASNKRKTMIRDHVVSVVKFYRERSYASFSSLTDSCHSFDSSSHASGASNSCSVERAVRNHSSKLSAGNRHFAVAMGKAERLAAYGAKGGANAAA